MHKPNAFTLIELLVVIAIIALLMAIIMPALSKAKRKAAGSACMANIKSIATAWIMYAHDNDDSLAPSQVLSGRSTSWVQAPQNEAGHATPVPEGRRTDIDYMDYGWAYKFEQQ